MIRFLHRSFVRSQIATSGPRAIWAVLLGTCLLLGTTSAQFTNSYGWGGAGMATGKRSSFANTLMRGAPFSAVQMAQSKCLPNKRLQTYIFELIQGELSRLQNCKELSRLPDGTLDYPDTLSDLMQ